MNVILIIVIIAIAVGIVIAIKEIRQQKEKTQRNNALLDAVRQGDKQTVQKLIAEGIDINNILCGAYGGYPLQIAVENGDKDMVSFLIDKGAGVNYGKRPLIIAVKNSDKEMLSPLIDKGAKVHLDFHGKLPLDFAENDEISALLKTYGAITKKEQDEAGSLFSSYVSLHYVEKAKSLIPRISNIDTACHGFIADLIAADERRAECMDVDDTVLMCAARNGGDIEMVKFLVENGANVNASNSHGQNAVLMAVHSQNAEIIDFLASKGANVNAKYFNEADSDMTALMQAAFAGNIEIVETLIRNGADVNAKSGKGVTALLTARIKGYTDIEILLKKNGAWG